MVDAMNVVRTLREDETGAAVDVLARAFRDDPLMVFLAAEKGSMLTRPRALYAANVRLGLRDGRVDVLDDMAGVAVWLRPGRSDIGPLQMLRSGMLTATLGMGWASLRRMATVYRQVQPMTKQVVADAYWLLLFLVVDPSRQGQGLGGSLIAPVLDHADAEGHACYLDSGNERNLSFYRRHGFAVAGEAQVPEGPHVWGMLRPPRTGAAH